VRRLAPFIATWILVCQAAFAQTLIISEFGSLGKLAVEIDSRGNMKLIGLYQAVIVNPDSPTPPPAPVDEPTGPGQLICVRPWSLSLDESDADLTIRESLDAARSQIPYIRLLPGTPDERLQAHPAERYRSLVNDQTRGWVFHVVPTRTTPRILNQGPLDADRVLGWVKVSKVAFAEPEILNEDRWLDVQFDQQAGELLGSLELPEIFRQQALAAAVNVKSLPGFQPIPKAEWSQWTARFPITRLSKSIRNITNQTMGSCVGHACANGIEAGNYMTTGDLFFRRISGMSMYKRIGRSANSGAYIPDAASEIFSRGILPVTGEPYPHTFAQDTGWNVAMPSGWEATGRLWKAVVYTVSDQESAFRTRMDWRLRDQFGRSSHSISGFAVTASGKWAYENSWGTGWGDLGKSIGYDSTFYSGYIYLPVLRDEIPVLMARELPEIRRADRSFEMQDAAEQFEKRIREIMEKHEASQIEAPARSVPKSTPVQPQGRLRLFRKSAGCTTVLCNVA
jgi:hypothetical protein